MNNIEMFISNPTIKLSGATLTIDSVCSEYGDYYCNLMQLLINNVDDANTAQNIADIVSNWITDTTHKAYIDGFNFAYDMIKQGREVVLF